MLQGILPLPVRISAQPKRGFTLIELAIVLAVAGLLFVGLWRLLSSGNQQVRDQAAASQQTQLIASIKGFLASAQGQLYMTNQASYTMALPLPSVNTPTTCTVAATVNTICSYLPVGFINTTPNSYNQTYVIQVLKDNPTAGVKPNNYSFMIVTTNGDVIPDTSGGRISGFIGGDGGFVYSTNVCGGPANFACGAYGAWGFDVTVAGPASYGFASGVATAGHIATRSFVSSSANNQFPWLDRYLMTGDPANAPPYNTMSTDLFLGGKSFWLGIDNTLTTGGGTVNMQGGIINLAVPQNPTPPPYITTATGAINLEGGSISGIGQSSINITGDNTMFNPEISISSACLKANPNDATCHYSLNVTGDGNVSGLLNANSLYAGTFIYQSSDLRLKKNIHPLEDPLANIMKLKPVTFTLKSNNQDSFGVIAQDLEKVYPQLVTKGDGMKAVNYDGLIGPLIGAVQELKKENDKLQQQLKDQQVRENKLEDQIKQGRSNTSP